MSRRWRLPCATPAGGRTVERVGQRAHPRKGVGDVGRPDTRAARRRASRRRTKAETTNGSASCTPLSSIGHNAGCGRQPLARRRPARWPTIDTALGRQPDPEHLHDHGPAGRRILSTKHRAHAAGTDLVQDAETPVHRTSGPSNRRLSSVSGVNSSTWLRSMGCAHVSTRRHAADGPRRPVDTPRGLCKSSRSVSSPSAPASTAGALAIDIRQLPWMRRLADRLRLRLRPARAVLRRRSAAARGLGRRRSPGVHALPRAIPALAAMLRAQLERRGAPGAALEAAAAFERPTHRRHRHRPAGRAVRRPALHAAQGPDRHQAGPAGHRRTGRRRRADLLDRLRGSRLGGGAALHGARRRPGAPHHHRRRCGRRRRTAESRG